MSEHYDIVIAGGEIVDGSGAGPYCADIGISGERIAKIASLRDAPAARIIDARGLVISPGFVDIHSHSDYYLFIAPEAPSSLLQGVTTAIGGNCGYSAAPVDGETYEERREAYLKDLGLEPTWRGMGEYLGALERLEPGINFGLFAGHNTIRASVMGNRAAEADKGSLRAMRAHLSEAMMAGAFGLSTGLIYPPACYSSREELVELTRTCARHGGIFSIHMRSEGSALIEAVEEAVEVARAAGASLQISHLKTSGPENWHKLDAALQTIEGAIAAGMDLKCDRYPYIASNTGLQSLLPYWAVEGTLAEKSSRLSDSEVRARIVKEMAATYRDPSYFDRVAIAQVFTERNRGLEGLTISRAAARRRKSELSFVLDLLIEEEFNVTALFHTMSEGNLERIISRPYVMIGSDSGCRSHVGPLAKGKVHPRIFGTFPRVLAKYVREKGVLTLPEAIKKMTLDPCAKLGIEGRGRIAAGSYADLVLFDPARVQDLATYEEPFRYPAGISHVLVNGRLAVEGGELTRLRRGRVLRKGP